jgi:hypothetical protein
MVGSFPVNFLSGKPYAISTGFLFCPWFFPELQYVAIPKIALLQNGLWF